MKEKIQYRYKSTLLALEDLEELGYIIDYNIEKNQIKTNPENFDIEYIYRYEGMSDPDDESSVYGIINNENGDKGVYVVGNLSTDEDVDHFLINLEIKRRTVE
ncbi:hypothetical protein [Empedobacter brevis]|uniref:hypothetical protein n=1 Tax=Empedobacter brevis TaxID=247 RepID=UPI0039AEDA09